MSLTREQIASIADLARLDLSAAEIPAYQQSLSSILEFIGALEAADTASVAPMAHPLPGLSQRLRPDVVTETDHHERVPGERPAGGRRPVPGAEGDRMSELHHHFPGRSSPRDCGRGASRASSWCARCLARIDAHQSALNAFISVTREQALKQAEAADRALAAGEGGALTGVPIAHKDIFCTAGRAHHLRLAHAR